MIHHCESSRFNFEYAKGMLKIIISFTFPIPPTPSRPMYHRTFLRFELSHLNVAFMTNSLSRHLPLFIVYSMIATYESKL